MTHIISDSETESPRMHGLISNVPPPGVIVTLQCLYDHFLSNMIVVFVVRKYGNDCFIRFHRLCTIKPARIVPIAFVNSLSICKPFHALGCVVIWLRCYLENMILISKIIF